MATHSRRILCLSGKVYSCKGGLSCLDGLYWQVIQAFSGKKLPFEPESRVLRCIRTLSFPRESTKNIMKEPKSTKAYGGSRNQAHLARTWVEKLTVYNICIAVRTKRHRKLSRKVSRSHVGWLAHLSCQWPTEPWIDYTITTRRR